MRHGGITQQTFEPKAPASLLVEDDDAGPAWLEQRCKTTHKVGHAASLNGDASASGCKCRCAALTAEIIIVAIYGPVCRRLCLGVTKRRERPAAGAECVACEDHVKTGTTFICECLKVAIVHRDALDAIARIWRRQIRGRQLHACGRHGRTHGAAPARICARR